MNQHPYLTPATEVNLKWIIDLNIMAKSIKFPEEKTQEKYLYDVKLGNGLVRHKNQKI